MARSNSKQFARKCSSLGLSRWLTMREHGCLRDRSRSQRCSCRPSIFLSLVISSYWRSCDCLIYSPLASHLLLYLTNLFPESIDYCNHVSDQHYHGQRQAVSNPLWAARPDAWERKRMTKIPLSASHSLSLHTHHTAIAPLPLFHIQSILASFGKVHRREIGSSNDTAICVLYVHRACNTMGPN